MSEANVADPSPERTKRPLALSIKRGLFGKCPNCGSGKLFRAFIKPVDECAHCSESFTAQQADDLPAYLVVLVVGHITVGGFMIAEMLTDWPSWVHLSIWVPATLILSIALLQPVKGGVIALQWSQYMHGFGDVEAHTVSEI